MTTTTSLPPDQASQMLAARLAASGATITSASPALVTGTVAWKKHPSIIVGVILLLVMILPGVLWFMFAGKKGTDPFAVQIAPNSEGGSWVDPSGTGRGKKAADAATGGLPR